MNQGYKIIGTERKTGVFNDHPYDNMILHTVRESATATGLVVEQIKMRKKLHDVFPAQVGDVVQPLFNSKGILEGLMTLPAWPK